MSYATFYGRDREEVMVCLKAALFAGIDLELLRRRYLPQPPDQGWVGCWSLLISETKSLQYVQRLNWSVRALKCMTTVPIEGQHEAPQECKGFRGWIQHYVAGSLTMQRRLG